MNFLVVDFEFSMKMTFGSPRAWFPEIIEVGAVVADERGTPTDRRYTAFIKPRFWPRLTDDCFGITGIRQQDVDSGIPLEEAVDHLEQMARSKDIWLVAWGEEDRKVLFNVCQKYGISCPFKWENYVDLAAAYRTYAKLPKTASLKNAVEASGIQAVGILHSAMDDAVNAALVMEKMIGDGWVPQPVNPAPEVKDRIAGISAEVAAKKMSTPVVGA